MPPLIEYAILVIAGLIPSLIWLAFFLHKDTHPEPKYLIAKVFLMGIIVSPIAVLLQCQVIRGATCPLFPSFDLFGSNTPQFFLWAAFVEEFVKFLAVYFVALRSPEFDEPIDAMIYMIVAGLGFAAMENILVLFRSIPDGIAIAFWTWLLRSIGATLLHALSCSLTGYFLAMAWFFRQHHKKLVIIGLVIATLFHFTFNLFLSTGDNQFRSLLETVGLLMVMSFLVSILFDKIKERGQRTIAVVPTSITQA